MPKSNSSGRTSGSRFNGATIYQIAIDAYGANTVLGMDLIKEFNPQIEDLNWVSAGKIFCCLP